MLDLISALSRDCSSWGLALLPAQHHQLWVSGDGSGEMQLSPACELWLVLPHSQHSEINALSQMSNLTSGLKGQRQLPHLWDNILYSFPPFFCTQGCSVPFALLRITLHTSVYTSCSSPYGAGGPGCPMPHELAAQTMPAGGSHGR